MLAWVWAEVDYEDGTLWRLIDPCPLVCADGRLRPDPARLRGEFDATGASVFAERLRRLLGAGVRLSLRPVPFCDDDEYADLRSDGQYDRLVTRAKAIRAWATEEVGTPAAPPAPAAPEWSEAMPPAEWRKRLEELSETTIRRHVKSGKLVVDKVMPKLWRVRLDSLRRYRGDS